MKTQRILHLASWILLMMPAMAQVPNILGYQGRVSVSGTGFNGTGQFKFALVNASGSTTYWSNDGTSSAGSQPTAAVSLVVSNGVYSVQLGDTVIPNMGAVPVSVFGNSDVRLRVWFNDTTNGWQLMTPDQRIAAVGYSMYAGGVTSGAIGSAQLASGLSLGGTTTLTGNLAMPATIGSSTGVITVNGSSFLHAFGSNNVFAGRSAGNFTTTGTGLTATGTNALRDNTTGSSNTANGNDALRKNTTGQFNTALGAQTLQENTTGSTNVAVGLQAMIANTIGSSNVAIGAQAMSQNISGGNNSAVGYLTMFRNTAGGNTAIGTKALYSNTTGTPNVASGLEALFANSTGTDNVAIGPYALIANTGGHRNTGVGRNALGGNTTGSNNVGIGYVGGNNCTTGSNNIHINHPGNTAESNTIRIGIPGTQTATFIAGISGATASGGVQLFINASGQLGTLTSSARFKEQIQDMDKASEAIHSLRPVTFRYRPEIDPKGIPQFGLIAEEVDRVNPDLVVRDDQGLIQTVRYEQVTAMLLNEVLKDHKRAETREQTISDLKNRIAELEAQAKTRELALEERLAKLEQTLQGAPKSTTASVTNLKTD